jgi:hypothetical protein
VKRSLVIVGAVCLLGYGLYGGFYVAGVALDSTLAVDDGIDSSDSGRSEGSVPPEQPATQGDAETAETGSDRSDGPPFSFERVDVGFNYTYAQTGTGNNVLVSRAGVYVSDYNRDSWPDVLLVGGERPVLYENHRGSFERSDALPALNRTARAALFVDYNNDGRDDLVLLTAGRAPLLLRNTGGTFERVGVFGDPLAMPSGATTADFDGDGCLDVFVYQYANWGDRLPRGRTNYSAPLNNDNGNPDRLYWGTCDGFRPANETELGIRGSRWTLAASALDLTGNGRPDIHTTNDYNHDVVYVNTNSGFEQRALGEVTNRNGMSSEVLDVNGDAAPDLFATNVWFPAWAEGKFGGALSFKANGNNLLVNEDGEFVDRASDYGLTRGGWGWAAVAGDFDNDGDEDLLHTTRHLTFQLRDTQFTDAQLRRLRSHDFYRYPAVWERDGTSFERVPGWRAGLTVPNGRGAARLDYDRDGHLDLLVASPSAGYRLYEDRGGDNRAVQVRVLDRNGTLAYGATVRVTSNGSSGSQWRVVHAGTDFHAQDQRLVHVGIGSAQTVTLRVRWPDGTERVVDVGAGRRITVRPSGVTARTPLANDTMSASP